MSYAYNVKRGKRAARARAEVNRQIRGIFGEAYIHMPPQRKNAYREMLARHLHPDPDVANVPEVANA